MTDRKPPGYDDLMEDLGRGGCPVCRAAAATARGLVASMLFEGVNDPGIRQRWRAAHGYCQDHALLLLQLARTDGQAIALLYQNLLRHVREEAAQAVRARRNWWRRAEAGVLEPHARCPVCEAADARADTYLALLSRSAEDGEIGRAVRRTGFALCVPHLRQGLSAIRATAARRRLLDVYLHADTALDAELEEYLRKLDTRFSGEPRGSEQTSWRRAFLAAVGIPHHRVGGTVGNVDEGGRIG